MTIPETSATALHEMATVTEVNSDGQDSDDSMLRESSGTVFLAVNMALAVFIILVASSDSESVRLTPNVEPVVISPRYDDMNVVSDDQLQRVLYRVRPALRSVTPNLNHFDHALRLWSPRAVFEDPDCFSGVELLGLLTDHRQHQQYWGATARPFLLANTNFASPYIEFRTRSGADSSSHVDHTLATLAESGTPLDYPVQTEHGEFQLQAAFAFSFERFSLNQSEYEWSALAFLHYLPHEKGWRTSEGQNITWDMITTRLMRQKLTQGSCYGTHRLHTLVCILRVDEDHNILSEKSRSAVLSYLQDVTRRLVSTQHEEGYWTHRWPGEEWDGPSAGPNLAIDDRSQRILATGHTLEWWALAPEEVLPERERIVAASQWLVRTIDLMTDSEVLKAYTFLTHAGRALALWRGGFPYELYRIPTSDHPPANPDSKTHKDDVQTEAAP